VDENFFSSDYGKVYNGATPPNGDYQLKKGPSSEGGDTFSITERGPGDIIVTAGDGSSEEFKNVTGIYSTLGIGKNSLNIGGALTEADGTTPVNETIIGGTGNDTIIAGGGNDLIEGSGGADQIQAGVGSDTIYGGTPSALGVGPGDTITGGSLGHNLIYGSSGADVINVPGANNTVFGGPSENTKAGPSVINGVGGGDLLVGGSGNDIIEGGNGSTIIGGGGNNLLVGGSGANLIYGGANASYEDAEALNLSTQAAILFGSPTTNGQNVIFVGAATLTLIKSYGNEHEALAIGLPVDGLPIGQPASGDGNDTVHAGPNGDQIFGGTANNLLYGGTGPDTIVGGPGFDTILGGGGNELIEGRGTDTINGGTGNDTIYGGPGSSTIYGDTGIDYIQGGNGGNTITGGSGNDTILGGNGNDTIVGGSGNDSIRGQVGNDTIQGGSGNDTIYGDAGADTIYGGSGRDNINGDAGNDTILGGTGNDTIYGDGGANTLYGGQGADYISAAGGNTDSVFGGSGNTTIYGDGNNDTLSGGEGNDSIVGGTGPDQITGGSGNDTITGGGGFDLILGGTGNDLIQGGTAGDLIQGGTGGDTITGGAGNETVYGGSLSNNITAGSGTDLLLGGASNDTIIGGAGSDTIYGGAKPGNYLKGGSGPTAIHGTIGHSPTGQGDTIIAGAGNTTIWGSVNNDLIVGGTGYGVIYAGMGNQTIYGGTGTNLIYGGAGNDLLVASISSTNTMADTIFGGTGTATIIGNAGDDLLYGGAGSDSIVGGGGDDVIYGGAGTGKTIVGGGGNDTIWASTSGYDSISGGAGNVEIFGEGGNNTITGGSGNDTIEGELTGNLISGGSGNDLLVGGEGGDTINAGDPSQPTPGTGQDTIYGNIGSQTPLVAGNDEITGNAGNDLIYAGVGTNTINPGTGPGTQVFNPGVAAAATYTPTPIPEQNPQLNAAATLPTGVPNSGVWATLAGSAGSSLATSTTNNGGPAIVADATTRYVAWIDTRSGIPAVYVATESGTSWNQLADSAQGFGISGFLQVASEPAIALLASGRPIVAWTAQTAGGTNIEVAEYDPTANGGTGGWVGLGGSLSAGGISLTGNASNAQILMVNGEPTVVWLDTTGGVSNIYAKQFNGTSWVALGTGAASGGGVSGSSIAVTEFAVATDGSRLAVAWTQDFASAPSQVYMKQYSAGAWSALGGSASGNGLSQGLYAASAPTLAYANGTLFAAWQQYITNPAQSETIFQQAPVIYAADYTNGAWQPAGTGAETGFGVSANPGISLAPRLASNGSQLVLAWSDEFIDSAGTDTHLYVSTWNGTSFAQALPGQASGEGVAQSSAGLGDLSLTLDPNGNPFAAWSDPGDGLAALQVIGTPTTPANIMVVNSGTSLQAVLNGANAGAGDVIYLTAGNYVGAITIGATNAGVTIVGQPGLGAILQGAVTVTGGNVTLQDVTIAGNVNASGSGFALRESAQTGGTLTLTGSGQLVFDSKLTAQGISLQGASNFELRGNRITSPGTGIEIGAGNSGTIDNNTITGTSIGIDIANAFVGTIMDNLIEYSAIGINYLAAAALTGNRIENNTTGVVATVNNAYGGFGFAPGSGVNVISGNATGVKLSGEMQDQQISGNYIGVSGSGVIGGSDLSLANDINGNTFGVYGFTGTIQFSRIDGNGTGIQATANLNVLHNLIYNNTTVGLEISGVSNVRTSDNTFYTATGDNIRIENDASNVEIQNSILWAETGYDIYVANNSQTGFFSDYNTLYAGATGKLVYWTRDFTDILNWQDDVALYDLHSVGKTVVNPDDGKPHFVDLSTSNFQLLPLVGGQVASDAALEQGSPIVEYDTQLQNGNLLTDPGFEQGLTGWTTDPAALAGVAPSGPSAYDGGSYFFAGPNTAAGYAQQQVNLLAAGYSVAQLDSGTLTVSFGGYTRSYPATPPDTGSITVSFIDASGTTVLGSITVNSANATDHWALTSGTIALPTGTRSIVYQFNANRKSGTSDNAYLDDAFVTLTAGSGPQQAVPGIGANYLTNSGFESGLDGWTASPGSSAAAAGQQTGYPAAFDGSSYFAAGAVQQGTVSQTVNLLTSGLTTSAIDAGGLNLVFGGRVISANAFPPDQGQITVTMLAADGTTVLGTSTVQAPNTTDRWALVGGTTTLVVGTRYVQYTFTATRQPGETYDESFLDDAFVSTAPVGVASPDGAYGAAAVADPTSGAARIALTSPVLYANWVDNAPHTITWNNFGNAGASTQSVQIALYQDTPVGPGLPAEPKLLEIIAASVPNTGSYTWIPANSGISYGTYGLRIQVSLVGTPSVFDRSTEAFTVPENGSTYYVNDASTANGQYTTAPGSNRNDGMLPSAPLPNIDNVLRNYTLTAGSMIYVDPGTYNMIAPFEISGALSYGLGIDQGFTVQGPTNGYAADLMPAIPGNPVNLIQLEDANFVTINGLTLLNAGRGLYVQASASFSARNDTISGMANEGVRIDTGSSVSLLNNLTVMNSGLAGIYLSATTGTISGADVTNSGTAVSAYQASIYPSYGSGLYDVGPVGAISGTFSGNAGWGVYLSNPGAVVITDSTVFGNYDGLYITNNSGTAVVGDPTLTDGFGNIVHDNTGYGIFATGSVTVAGNVVYDESGAGSYGIEVQSGASAVENVVYASRIGIIADGSPLVTENRVYDNALYGIDSINDAYYGGSLIAITDNVIYSNATGIYDNRYYASTSILFGNNLIYANTTAAISIIGQSGISIVNNTIDQPVGDGIDISGANSGTQIRNNILVIGTGIGINVAADSENGFASDYNMFYLPNRATGAIGDWQGVLRLTLGAWQTATFTDLDSFTGNPLFVNPTGSEGVLGYVSPTQTGYDDDFHLQSQYADFKGGSLAPIIGASGKPVFPAIVGGTDAAQSPAIDRGASSDSYASEPAPNGGYINLGNFGNTAQASESPSQYILVLSPAAGATVQAGTSATITWRAFGFSGTVDLLYSTDGTTFTSIATGVPDSGSYAWSVPVGLTPGSTYVIKVAADSASVSGVSQAFTVSGKITDYYVSTTGNDANDGLTAATPKTSIQALLTAYTLGAGDTVFLAAGTYAVTTNINLTSVNSGTSASNGFTITGPTSGPGAVLNRGNLNVGQEVFNIQGGSYITIENLTIAGANFGVEIGGASAGVQLLNDTIAGNSDAGIEVDVNAGGTVSAVTGLIIEADVISGNGLDVPYGPGYGGNQDGVRVQQGNGAVQFINDQVFANNNAGIYLQDGYDGAGISTIQGGAYYDQTGAYGGTGYGIYDQTGSLIENVLVYANNGDGIYSSNNGSSYPAGIITGSTVFGNRDAGIEAHTADVTDSLVYSQLSTTRSAIELDSPATGTGNTVFGSTSGIFAGGSSEAMDNLVYDVSGSAVSYTLSDPAAIVGNTLYGNGIGISGAGYYTGPTVTIDGNLIYDNTTAAISLSGTNNQASIVNNTIDQLTGTGIALTGDSMTVTIENNIIVAVAGPAISVAPSAEGGFASDYNLFDVGSTSTVSGGTVGTIGVWEGVSYTDLATWYYELGFDQHSQVGNPDFVAAAGVDGILGLGTPTGSTQVIDNSSASGFATTGTWAAVTGPYFSYTQITGSSPSQNAVFTNLTNGGTYEIGQISGSGTILSIGTPFVESGTTLTTAYHSIVNGTTTTAVLLPYIGFDGNSLGAAAGSGATATWTFTGLTPGQVYKIGVTWPQTTTNVGNGNDASYVVTSGSGSGAVLAAANLDQYNTTPSSTVPGGFSNGGTSFATVGLFVTTGSTAVVTLSGAAGNAVVADATVLVPVGVNGGADDNFHVQAGSPAIDAGDPTTAWLSEPTPNGGRVNQGYDGNTAQAQVSPAATSIQVLSPGDLAKYAVGAQVPINFQTDGLTTTQPLLLLHAGGASVTSALGGDWSGDAYRTTGQSVSDTLSASQIGTLTNIPTALFSTAADLSTTAVGQKLSFALPVANGTYTLKLYFADPSANAAGQRVFNIVANGVTLQANYDIFAAAKAQFGNGNHAVSLTLTVTVTGGQGLELDFVNAAGYYGALVNGIELDQPNVGGTASPTATVQVSTDGGASWSTIASSVPINSFGQGQYVWTVNQTSNGNTALVRVLSGSVSGISQPFLLANGGTNFYVNDASQAGDQYTTAPGNDANSGKSPDQPVASLAALLRAYPIGPGDTIHVDAGNYTLPTNIVLPASDSGSAAAPVLITGPTIGSQAIFNRGNTSTNTDVFDLLGIGNIVIQNVTTEGAYDGVDITNAASGITLQNDVIVNNLNIGVNVPYGALVTNLVVSNSAFNNDGSLVYGYGIYFGYNNSGGLFLNDQVYSTGGTGLFLNGSGNQTVQGGAYYNNIGDGIDGNSASLIEDVVVYGNSSGNGAYGIYLNGGTVTGSTAFGNRSGGIDVSGSVLVSDNLVYDQLTSSSDAIDINSSSTAIGNTTYGDVNGIWVGNLSTAVDNLSYDNSGAGLYYTAYAPLAITGNTLYGNAIGLLGAEGYNTVATPITGNLIYQNTTAGIALTNGINQSIVNNTIDELVGTAISLSGSASATMIENNILAVAAGPAITVAPSAEGGFVSDYNFFDATGTGAIASWEGVSYTSLAAWYYATGADQHSQTGNPEFVNPAGADGILGFSAQPGTPQVVTAASASGFSTTGIWTAYTGGTGGAGSTALQTAAGSGGTATWTFTGLTPGVIYQVAVNWPSNFITNEANNATYTVRDANGVTLTEGQFNQYDYASSGLTSGGAGFAMLGVLTATTNSITVTLGGTAGALVIADGVLVQALGANNGVDDNFHLQAGSPAIDAGNPATPYALEPGPNGGRVNQGYDGNTPAAQTSGASQTLQVLSPAQFGKYEVGQQVPISITGADLGQTQAVLTINAGGGAIATTTQGNWQTNIDQTSGTTFTNTAPVTGLSSVPTALFASGTSVSSTTGTALNYDLSVANGTYTLRLYFADPNATAIGQRVFNVVVNGTTMVANYDIFKTAGGENKGVELDLTVTATGGNGINLSLVSDGTSYGAMVNAIEVDQAVAGGAVAPTANIQVSTDNGLTWSLIATNVPINRYGQGQFIWTVDRTTTGSTVLIRVTSGTLVATSQPFLLANGGTSFYIDDSSLAGNQYTTAVGNDANSGKSPDQPMASLAALLRAYPIGPGDTIYVDTGNYVATSDAVLPASDGGSVADPALIVGPTNGGTVVINRDNTAAGIGVIDVTGASNIIIENIGLTGAYYGIDLTGASSGITVLNDSIYGNADNGIVTDNNSPASIANLTIADSLIHNNSSSGIDLQDGLLSATLLNDQIYNNGSDGIDIYTLNGNATVSGGAVYDNIYTGISLTYDGNVQNVQVYGNGRDGIDATKYSVSPVLSGNTIYANADAGIYGSGASIIGNTVYGQVNTNYQAIEFYGGGTISGNTVYGSSTGLYAGSGGTVLDNLVYENSADGILLNPGYSYVVSGNIAYGNKIGIGGGGNTTTIENNLVYNNISAGIAITSGTTLSIVNNTVYQSVGQALMLSGVSYATVENNILWVDQGSIISVASGATTGFLSAYNLFYQGANPTPATLGLWQGVAEATLANWQTASGQDVNGSKTGNPGFVNMAGADGILGGPGTAVGAGADDDFELKAGSSAIDAANAYVAPFTDLLGQPRHDDPATANTGIGYPQYVQTNGAASAPSGGTALSVGSSGGVTTYTLPFAFSLYGVSYTSVIVSSQGYLQFAGPNSTGYDTPGMANFLGNVRIAPFWAAINTAAATGDGVFVSTTATSVTFRWQAGTSASPVNFAVTLNNNGSFSFNYGAGNAGLSPIIGVSAGNGLVYVMSTASGGASLGNAASEVWTPQPQPLTGYTYFDIGAFEFQGSSADTTPPTVVSISNLPGNNGSTGLAFTSLSVQFSKSLDLVSALSPANYSLIKADVNGLFTTAGATQIPVIPVYTLGSTTVTLQLPSGVLVAGQYQLTLSGTRAIFDQSGNALAGNGTTAGTNYVQYFTINRSADVAPVATAQSVSVAEGGTQQIVLTATDTQGNPLTYSIVTAPGDGTLSAITNGNTLTYTPTANFFGADRFTFQATDPDGGNSQAAVSLTVTPVNQAPVAIGQSISVTHDAAQVIVLGGTDAETPASQLVYTITTQPAHGTLVQSTTSPDAFTYTPSAGYLGADSFAFTVIDTGNPAGSLANQKTSVPATVSVTVVDPAPVGVANSYTTRAQVPLVVPAAQGVLANDTDGAGDTLTATLVTTTTHGTLVLNSDGSFVYTPGATFTGTDSFTYLPHGTYVVGSATTVTISVAGGVSASPAPPTPPPPPGSGKLAPAAPALPGAPGALVTTTVVPTSAITVLAANAVAPVTTVASPVVPQLTSASVSPVTGLSAYPITVGSGATMVSDSIVFSAAPVSVRSADEAAAPLLLLATPSTTQATKASTTAVAPSTAKAISPTAATGAWVDPMGLMAAPNPIVLPSFTLPGDETSALMLPAASEISHLPKAFARAAQRFTERSLSIITFVDPVSGYTADSTLPAAAQRTQDRSWLLVDPDPYNDTLGYPPDAASSRIRWDSHPT
jgi:Ca2+-binding RTX toxin-like protein